MTARSDRLAERDDRLLRHCREGYHADRVLAEAPLDRARLDALVAESPYRTAGAPDWSLAPFEHHLAELRARLPR